ncbi:MAG: hypothetical protein HY699_10780 [Deltaproteobacteria bacterium]|nr:hypothetical protein [Deltaproteobacteria bacterium]
MKDRFPERKRWKQRLPEKGGKERVVPVHHILECLGAYIAIAHIREQSDGPLFPTLTAAPGRCR